VEQYQINLPETLDYEKIEKTTEKKNRYTNICKFVAQWSHDNLLKNPTLLHYFQKRGFNRTSLTSFMLGYFPGGLHVIKALIQAMREKQILPKDLIETHILNEGKTVLYSPFEDRIIFPIKNHLGQFCGFGGRIIRKEDTRPKYYNSREDINFIKGDLLFGLDLAKKSIQESGIVFLVEGYTDCIAMVQHGFTNTVATLGTACTRNHLKLLSRYAQELYILYDEDNAGKNAILRLTQLCWEANLDLKVVNLPPQEDPASFLEGNNNLQPLIEQAQDIFLFFINSLGNNFSSKPLSSKLGTIRTFLQTMAPIQDSLKQDILLQKGANTFNIPFESLKRELLHIKNKENQSNQTTEKTPINKPVQLKKPIPALEKKIFCAIVNNIKLLNRENEQYILDHLSSPLCTMLKQLKLASQGESFVFSQFFDQLNDLQKQWLSQLLLSQEEISETIFNQLYVQWQKQQWKIIAQETKTKLLQVKQQGNEKKMQEILDDFIKIRKKMILAAFSKDNSIIKGD
ncbi:MAG: toprim domain-containing protein, partial [Candidatus Babeliales bacterium]